MKFSHIKEKKINMVDISTKDVSTRVARAKSQIKFKQNIFKKVLQSGSDKGEIFNTARCAGILAAKKTSDLIPLCHNININSVSVKFDINEKDSVIEVIAEVRSSSKTGVEMEAMIASSVASLTIYDMCKSLDKSIIINDLKLLYKSGGKSGEYRYDFV